MRKHEAGDHEAVSPGNPTVVHGEPDGYEIASPGNPTVTHEDPNEHEIASPGNPSPSHPAHREPTSPGGGGVEVPRRVTETRSAEEASNE